MPELPEVETLRRQLQKAIVGKTIAQVGVLRVKSFQGSQTAIVGKTVQRIDRRAKVLAIRLGKGFPVILVHLKMTGQLIYQKSKIKDQKERRVVGGHPTPDWVGELPSKHTRVMVRFTDSSQLFFNDLRVFGWLKVVGKPKELERELGSFQGIEPLTPAFTAKKLFQQLMRTSRAVKLALMDQKLIAGVGNIYANDALWDARIHPKRPANSLTGTETARLAQSIEKVIRLGIKYGGASENTYRQLSGLGGTYQEHFLVYKQGGKTCPRCKKAKIKKIKLGGRGTYLCLLCQGERYVSEEGGD
jgi:formamidopyrimidine-DNA glycosylase